MLAENTIDNIDRIKEKYGFGFILALSGGADTKLPQLVNDQSQQSQEIQKKHDDLMGERIEKLIYDCLRKFDGLQHRIAIQTGGTKGGVPEVATKVAKKLGFRTIGIYPEVGAKYALGEEYIDFPSVLPLLTRTVNSRCAGKQIAIGEMKVLFLLSILMLS